MTPEPSPGTEKEKEKEMLTVEFICELCGVGQTTPGALIFGPPDDHSRVAKWHICDTCFYDITPNV